MRILLDTSVLVAAMIESHPAHDRALLWLHQVRNGEHNGLVAAHSVAELYSILTVLPLQPRISPAVAQQLIKHNVLDLLEVVFLSDEEYATLVEHLADLGIVGGATYDALILHAAAKAGVDRIITLNEKDFRRVYPSLADRITAP